MNHAPIAASMVANKYLPVVNAENVFDGVVQAKRRRLCVEDHQPKTTSVQFD